MEYIREPFSYECKGRSVVTLGKFDGVHRGHQMLIGRMEELAAENDWNTVVFTFDISPQVCMGSTPRQMLMTNSERKGFIERMDIDILVECPFTKEVMNMTPEKFVTDVLIDRLHAAAVVIGDDFRFGKNRAGDGAFLQKMGKKYGFSVEITGKKTDEENGREISSSYVREEVSAGRLEKAAGLLGYNFYIEGKIVHGRHLGTTIGIPTINIVPSGDKLLPPNGVYFSRTEIEGGKCYNSITNIGVKPTVDGENLTVETNLFDCDEDLYGKKARVSLLHFSRPEMQFASVDELKKQMNRDIAEARKYA